MRTWPVGGVRSGARRLRGIAGVETRLVGRSRELGVGREAVEALTAGGGWILVSGEPGIGKSRLLAELRTAQSERRTVARGPLRLLRRIAPVLAAARPPAQRLDRRRRRRGGAARPRRPATPAGAAVRERADELYPYLGAILDVALEPEAATRTAELSPEALQWRTFEVVGELFARLAEVGRVVARDRRPALGGPDVGSLARAAARARGAVTGAARALPSPRARPSGLGPARTCGARVPAPPARARPRPLGDADGELLAALAGLGTLPAQLERRVLDVAEGNPFFLEELVRSLIDAGALVQTDDGWQFEHDVKIEVPPTVEKVILARLDRLSPESHRVITAASALGRRFALPLLDRRARRRRLGRLAARAAAARPDPAEPPLAAAGVPLPPCADPGDRLPDAARRDAVSAPPARGGVARGAVRRQRGAGARPARASLACGRERGEGGGLPPARGRQGAAGVRARRGDRVLPRAPADSRAARRAAGERARALQARARVAHLASVRRGERDLPARLRPWTPAVPRERRPSGCASQRAFSRTTRIPNRRSRGRTSSSACSSSTASSRRGPSARSCRRSPNGGRSPTTGCATSFICARA